MILEDPITSTEAITEIQGPDLLTMTQEGTTEGHTQMTREKVEAIHVKKSRHRIRKDHAQTPALFRKSVQRVHAPRKHPVQGDKGLRVQGE